MNPNQTLARDGSELADLRDLKVVLKALTLVLTRQRAAIAALDIEELAAASAEKRRLGDEAMLIQSTLQPAGSGDDRTVEMRRDIKRLAVEVRCAAQANAILMSDARKMIGHVLGTETVANGYDRRARRYSEPRASLAKAV